MAANKYLEHDAAGGMREKAATISSTGAGDDGKIVALDSTGRLDQSMMPVGVAPDTASIEASEALAAGDWINIWEDTTTKCRKADATVAGKETHGFVLVSVLSGVNADVFFEGINTQVTGMTGGQQVFLSTSPGGSTHTAPSATGNVVQKMGRAIAATAIQFEPSNPIELV